MARLSFDARISNVIKTVKRTSPTDDKAFLSLMAFIRAYQRKYGFSKFWLVRQLMAQGLVTRVTGWRWVTGRFIPHPSSRLALFAAVRNAVAAHQREVARLAAAI